MTRSATTTTAGGSGCELIRRIRAASGTLQLANLYLTVHKTESAVAAARRAIQMTPDSPEAHLLLARGLLAAGDIAGARPELQKLVDRFPQSSRIHEQMGELLEHA